MARPLRIEFEGALYHVISRGDRREDIVDDDEDRKRFLGILGDVVDRMGWLCHAYCLMDNHYHLVIETPNANLSPGMRHLNGIFTQSSNRLHARSGHLFQGRYKAILVDSDAYFLELARYVVLNPVRAKMVSDPGEWAWSSYRACAAEVVVPDWLTVERIQSYFGRQRLDAGRKYKQFVSEGVGKESIWTQLNRQMYLGDDDFVSSMQERLGDVELDANIPGLQRCRPAPSLEDIESTHGGRNQAIVAAYETGAYSYALLAEYFKVHFTTIGRIVRENRRMLQ